MNLCLEQTLFVVKISELAQSSVDTVSKLNTKFNVVIMLRCDHLY
jgi:hypothetical protein